MVLSGVFVVYGGYPFACKVFLRICNNTHPNQLLYLGTLQSLSLADVHSCPLLHSTVSAWLSIVPDQYHPSSMVPSYQYPEYSQDLDELGPDS